MMKKKPQQNDVEADGNLSDHLGTAAPGAVLQDPDGGFSTTVRDTCLLLHSSAAFCWGFSKNIYIYIF